MARDCSVERSTMSEAKRTTLAKKEKKKTKKRRKKKEKKRDVSPTDENVFKQQENTYQNQGHFA